MTLYPDAYHQSDQPGPGELDVRLGALRPDLLAVVWRGDFDPARLFWCSNCCRVYPASQIWLDGEGVYCANCEASSASLHWWDGWPRVAFPGWVSLPVEGTYYFLPGCVHNSIAEVATRVRLTPYGYEEDPLRFLTAPPEGHTH